MKAIVLSHYGAPADLRLEDRPKPEPRAGEVLVKVHATSINDWDWSFVRGKPYLYRPLFGLRKPSVSVLGCEVAGIVESLGAGATHFQPGARVYGDLSEAGFGGFAEYVSVRESALAPMPENMSFEHAAALPHAGMLAQQGLIDVGALRQGERVLINGAGGGVGMIGVQIAKRIGAAEVTGIDSGDKLAMLRDLGCDHTFDYTQHDFAREAARYDLILDTKSTRSPFACARALTPGGRYVTVGGDVFRILQLLILGPLLRVLSGKQARMVALKTNKDMPFLADAFAAGLRLILDGPYSLADVPKALARFGAGKHLGKVVVRVAP